MDTAGLRHQDRLENCRHFGSNYYARRKSQGKPKVYNGGRPVPGFSMKTDGQPVADEQIKEWIHEYLVDEEAAYGYRKITVRLRRDHGLQIKKKKVYRLMKEENLLHPQREKQRFFFLLSLIDVYDRSVIDYYIGLNCEGKHASQILQRALWRRQQFEHQERPVIRTDNGPQFISHIFESSCETFQVEHERIPPKIPNKNAHIEAFHSILEKECLERHEFESYRQAYETVTNYLPTNWLKKMRD